MIKILNNPLDIILEVIRKVNDINAEIVFLPKEQCDGKRGFTKQDSKGNFLIGIAADLRWQDTAEAIAHEAAHIMAKSHNKPIQEQHDMEWEFWVYKIRGAYGRERIKIEREMEARKE